MGKLYNKIGIGDSYTMTQKISSEIIEKFAILSGDTNPIHLSESYAKKTRFGQRIAHGMLIASFLSRILGCDFPGEGTIFLKSEINFLNPVFINDKIEISVTVIQKFDNKKQILFDTICNKSNNIPVVKGTALVLYNR